ncbi:MAG: NnrU family protein [Sedimentitalea sp.]
MGFGLLILGLLMWAGAHFFKRVAPDRRAGMGDAGKGVVTGLLVVSIILMVLGYRAAPFLPVWSPPSFFTHINNLLMVLAIFMLSPAPKRGLVLNKVRHPMLIGFKTWAVSHLLVNGDVASILLFGGLLAWAVASVIVINKSEPDWAPRPAGTYAKDAMFLGGSVVLLVIIGGIHGWIGPWPFGG